MEDIKFTLTDIKRENRKLKRQLAKLSRKEATMRKLREENANLTKQIGFVKDDLSSLGSLMWAPPVNY
jgi:cell shape-determining protein MreC